MRRFIQGCYDCANWQTPSSGEKDPGDKRESFRRSLLANLLPLSPEILEPVPGLSKCRITSVSLPLDSCPFSAYSATSHHCSHGLENCPMSFLSTIRFSRHCDDTESLLTFDNLKPHLISVVRRSGTSGYACPART